MCYGAEVTEKIAGVHYLPSPLGVDLPVVDVSHDAFERPVDSARQRAYVDEFMRQSVMPELLFGLLPRRVRAAAMGLALRGSRLAPGIQSAEGSFLGGMATYLFKVGQLVPDALSPIDRKIIATLPARAVRWRIFDMVDLLAEAILPRLVGDASRPLWLVNIAGGPALDSLNAVAALARTAPERMRARTVKIAVFDGDSAGPDFGARALDAWRNDGPLAGLEVRFERYAYDWNDPRPLVAALATARAENAVVVASSEGGLFEYGADHAIEANLRALREGGTGRVAVVGSVTRNDDVAQRMIRGSTAALVPRGLATFRSLVQRAGFDVTRSIARPFADDVCLEAMS